MNKAHTWLSWAINTIQSFEHRSWGLSSPLISKTSWFVRIYGPRVLNHVGLRMKPARTYCCIPHPLVTRFFFFFWATPVTLMWLYRVAQILIHIGFGTSTLSAATCFSHVYHWMGVIAVGSGEYMCFTWTLKTNTILTWNLHVTWCERCPRIETNIKCDKKNQKVDRADTVMYVAAAYSACTTALSVPALLRFTLKLRS